MCDKRDVLAVVFAVTCALLIPPETAFSQQAAEARQSGACELQIEGHSILSLTLISAGDVSGQVAGGLTGKNYTRPGKSLQLPAGRYRVESVEMEGNYQFTERFASETQWFEVSADKPYRLVIGAPLSPQVTVTRHGKFLQMDYDLVDAAGRSYVFQSSTIRRPDPPRFSVYQNDQLLGSDSFAYG